MNELKMIDPQARYPIAPNGIFESIQGEGADSGRLMRFVRLAGCSVGCPGCDTDYSVAERLTAAEIVERLRLLEDDVSTPKQEATA